MASKEDCISSGRTGPLVAVKHRDGEEAPDGTVPETLAAEVRIMPCPLGIFFWPVSGG